MPCRPLYRRIRFRPAAMAAGMCALWGLGLSAPAQAKDPKVSDSAGKRVQKSQSYATQEAGDSKRQEGWQPGLFVGGTFNLMDARNVVGQQAGTTVTVGAVVDGSLELNKGPHEWRNQLRAAFGATRTSTIDEFVKTNDGLQVESVYLLHALEGFGPYARLGLNSQMFGALDIRGDTVDYVIAKQDGSTENLRGRRLALSDPFQPLELKQSLGVFYQPLQHQRLTLESRAGLGAQETLADGALALKDDANSDAIEVTALSDNFLVGTELVLNSWGTLDEAKRISYAVGASVLLPFVTSEQAAGDERGLLELTSIETSAALNVRIFRWASFGYKLRAVRQPLLLDQWQVQNELLFTVAAALGSKAPAPPKKSCACPQKATPKSAEPKP
jgi:hypothetical protein